MKSLFIITFFLVVGPLHAFEHPLVTRFLNSEPEKARLVIEKPAAYAIRNEFPAAAIARRQLDLLEVCFLHSRTRGLVDDEVAKLPDSEYRDRLVVFMLKTKSYYWPEEDPEKILSRGSPAAYLKAPFTDTILKYCPDMELEFMLLATHESRMKVATAIETEMRKTAKPEGIAEHPAAGSPTSPASDNSPARPSSVTVSKPVEDPTKSLLLWLLGGGILLAAGIGWIVAKIRKSADRRR